MMISIIIPVHNQVEMTRECIGAIRENTDDYEIVIVDNGSEMKEQYKEYMEVLYFDGTMEKVVSTYAPYQEGRVVRNEENLGFPAAVNQGIRAAKGDTIIILNNDVFVTPRWAEILQERLSDGLDMVGAVTNQISGPQQVLIDQYEDVATLNIAAESRQKEKEGQWYPWHRLVFFCVAIKKEVIKKIGLLDEIYTPGNYEDDDYCMRAIESGFKLGVAEDCYVHHGGSVTHQALGLNYQELTLKNRKVFNEKWGDKYEEMVKKNNEA